MSRDDDFVVQECTGNTNTTGTWPNRNSSLVPQHKLAQVIVDPLQDLVVTISFLRLIDVQRCSVFWLEMRMLSSQAPHPDSVRTSLDCRHHFHFDARVIHYVASMKEPAICGDRMVVPYCIYTDNIWTKSMFIQVVDWKKGEAVCVSPVIELFHHF